MASGVRKTASARSQRIKGISAYFNLRIREKWHTIRAPMLHDRTERIRRALPSCWESHLVLRAAGGDEEAFRSLCDTHRPALEAVSHRMLRNPEDAKDAVQETLLKAFRAIGEFDSELPLRPWLCRICANCCIDTVRGRRRDGERLDAHEAYLKTRWTSIFAPKARSDKVRSWTRSDASRSGIAAS